jgi:uncharacterized membrane-anchored protein
VHERGRLAVAIRAISSVDRRFEQLGANIRSVAIGRTDIDAAARRDRVRGSECGQGRLA